MMSFPLKSEFKKEEIYESIDECVQRNVNLGNAGFQSKTSCISVDLPAASATAKRVLKMSSDKLCGTFNNVCTKFETLSQRLRRSTRRKAPLVNSPGTPLRKTPNKLGRTPTKMYSPFNIETPRGKENNFHRPTTARRSLNRESVKKVKSPVFRGFPKTNKVSEKDRDLSILGASYSELSNDIQDAQISFYQFQHTAHQLLRTRPSQ